MPRRVYGAMRCAWGGSLLVALPLSSCMRHASAARVVRFSTWHVEGACLTGAAVGDRGGARRERRVAAGGCGAAAGGGGRGRQPRQPLRRCQPHRRAGRGARLSAPALPGGALFPSNPVCLDEVWQEAVCILERYCIGYQYGVCLSKPRTACQWRVSFLMACSLVRAPEILRRAAFKRTLLTSTALTPCHTA